MKYLDYFSEIGSRIDKGKKGKGTTNLGSFSGFGEGKLKKPYKE